MVGCIYGLADPRTKEIKYIGWAVNITERYNEHILESKRGIKSHKCNWIRELSSLQLKPDLEALDSFFIEDWALVESAWILYGYEQGWPLTNMTLGGEGTLGWLPSEETREVWKRQRQGNTFAVGNKSKLGQKDSEKTKQKKSSSNKGNKPSENTIRRAKEMNSVLMLKNTHAAKLSEENVLEIINLLNCGKSIEELRQHFNVSYNTIRNIKLRKTWRWLNEQTN